MSGQPDKGKPQGDFAMSGMFRDVRILLKGAVIAQVLGLVFIPVFSRLYSPSSFGEFSVYQSAMLIASVVACLRYDQAILAADNSEEALSIFKLCGAVGILMAIIVFLAVTIFLCVGVYNDVFGSLSLYWLVPATFFAGVSLAASALFTRLEEFRLSASSKIAQSATNGAFAIPYGLAAPSAAGLVLGDISGKAVVVLMAFKKLLSATALATTMHDLKILAKKFRDFPRLSVLGGLLNNGGSVLTPLLIFHLYGAHHAGQYALVDRAIGLPLGLVIITLNQAFTSHFGRLLREDALQAKSYFNTLVRQCFLFGVIPIAIFVAVAPNIFPFVFGAEWQIAGQYAQILSIAFLSSIVMGPVMSALVVAGKLGWQLLWELARLLLLATLWIIVAQYEWPIELSLLGYAVITAAVNLVFLGLVRLHLHQRINSSISSQDIVQ